MTKTLLTISFAMDISEDHLATLANGVEETMRKSIAESLATLPSDIPRELIDEQIDFYGATLTLRRSIFPEEEVL